MSMLSRFLSSGVKSQLKNVRLLHFRSGATPYFPHITTASRQFIVGRVSFLKQQDNIGIKLEGFVFAAGQPAEGALALLPQSLPLRKESSSKSSDADNFNRQVKNCRNSRDLLQFYASCDSQKLRRSSLFYVCRKLFGWLKTEKSNAAEKTRILVSVGMQKLCQAVKKYSCSISPVDLTTICGLFVYLNAPGDHPTFDVVLRLLSKHSSSLTLINIRFLHSLMNQLSEGSKSPTSKEITQILPILFECQLSMRSDDTDLGELVSCLEFAVRNNYSESVLKTIFKSIGEKQTQLTCKQAHKIVLLLQSLGKYRLRLPGGPELLGTSSSKILEINARPHAECQNMQQVNMLLKFCKMKCRNSIVGQLNSEYSTEAACNRLIEAYQDEDMEMEDEKQIALDSFNYITKTLNRTYDQNLGTPPCRHCAAKRESLRHVLVGCPKTTELRLTRNHEIRSIIAKALRKTPSFGKRFWTVEEEVDCHDDNGSIRRVHIFCYDKEQKVGFIICPTICFERVTTKMYRKKKIHNAYERCSKYFKDLYDLDQIKVIGFSVGAGGMVAPSFEKFRTLFALGPTITKDIAVAAIRGSTLIAEHHLYSRETDLLKLLG